MFFSFFFPHLAQAAATRTGCLAGQALAPMRTHLSRPFVVFALFFVVRLHEQLDTLWKLAHRAFALGWECSLECFVFLRSSSFIANLVGSVATIFFEIALAEKI